MLDGRLRGTYSRPAMTAPSWRRPRPRCGHKWVVVMVRYFVSTDWRVPMTALLIALFYTVPLFLVAYKLGVHVRDDSSAHHRADAQKKRGRKKPAGAIIAQAGLFPGWSTVGERKLRRKFR